MMGWDAYTVTCWWGLELPNLRLSKLMKRWHAVPKNFGKPVVIRHTSGKAIYTGLYENKDFEKSHEKELCQ